MTATPAHNINHICLHISPSSGSRCVAQWHRQLQSASWPRNVLEPQEGKLTHLRGDMSGRIGVEIYLSQKRHKPFITEIRATQKESTGCPILKKNWFQLLESPVLHDPAPLLFIPTVCSPYARQHSGATVNRRMNFMTLSNISQIQVIHPKLLSKNKPDRAVPKGGGRVQSWALAAFGEK